VKARARDASSAAISLVVALTLVGAGCAAEESSEAAGESARQAPDFSLPDLNGGTVALSDYRGQVVIVDFWATWCPPCYFQVPELNKLQHAHSERGDVVIIGVSVDVEGAAVVKPWIEEQGVDYTVVLGDEQLAHEFGAVGFPTMAIVGPDGRIEALHVGLVEYQELEEAVAPLLPAAT
jgi:peroxiredoxin